MYICIYEVIALDEASLGGFVQQQPLQHGGGVQFAKLYFYVVEIRVIL